MRRPLASAGRAGALGERQLQERGEHSGRSPVQGGRALPSVLEDVFEAFVSAVYHDQLDLAEERRRGGNSVVPGALPLAVAAVPSVIAMAEAQRFVVAALEAFVDIAEVLDVGRRPQQGSWDAKSRLNEFFHKRYGSPPRYQCLQLVSGGDSGAPQWSAAVMKVSTGEGEGGEEQAGQTWRACAATTKRAAQQLAAQAALLELELLEDLT